ncbi:AAA family ATPase [Fulvivirga ulvae]|uniref:AAA family ATPase n=1 Tax=Fulvivirga ulvae TaxID=2904245 RepID=UPI001F2446A0|nr:AAA family ATPase [Fulvivirga ulvae]UII35010.1 AAA family ATPase [Fulvivirga ulvae]
MISHKRNNNFIVITGGPGAGKTTLLRELQRKGYRTIPEIARELIKDQKGNNGNALPWKNRELFKDIMFVRSVKSYSEADENVRDHTLTFFDRGFLDSICYSTLIQSVINNDMVQYANKWRYNNKVFVLPPWQEIFTSDGERRQDWEEAVLTHKLMVETYHAYGYCTLEVPKAPVKDRCEFVINELLKV